MSGERSPVAVKIGVATATAELDERPAGDRYFRHPGDVLRLVLWGTVTVLAIVFVQVATGTSEGVTTDLGDAATAVPRPARELLLVLVQAAALAVPVGVLAALAVRRRWRRSGVVLLAAILGAVVVVLLNVALDLSVHVPGSLTGGTWVASTRFPPLAYVGGASAATTAGGPWLSRPWRRAAGVGLGVLVITMALAGSAGVPQVLLALAAGAATGSALLVAVGAPNRRPSPAVVAAGLRSAGLDVTDLTLERAVGGRSQLYSANATGDRTAFVKVYARDSRDADLLYRGYRSLMLRGPTDDHSSWSLEHDVEREALLVLLARRGGVACPALEVLTKLSDGSMALALEHVPGRRLDEIAHEELTSDLLDDVWRQVVVLHRARLAHRALRAANILVVGPRAVIIDLGFGEESASSRLQAIDRAELLTSLATLVGADAAVQAAARVVDPQDLAAAVPFLQPLALSAATRRRASKSLLTNLRAMVSAATGVEPAPLERLVRVRPRTLITIAALAGAFYILLPQLAHVGDSFRALRTANWAWLLACIVLSLLTYVASAIGLAGGVPQRLPFVANVETQLASSFVNRVTPANVGGMALNVRFMQKAGVDPAAAVTGMGLNVIAGAIVHMALLFVFLAWAGQGGGSGFKIPTGSKTLVLIVAVLLVAGAVVATRRGRRLVRTHVVKFLEQSWASLKALGRSPVKMVGLFGGSCGVTLAYIGSLAAAVAAFHGDVTFAQVGAVYLGASIVAAAAPTPGGLGAMEAALVAGFTGVGMEPGVAVAAVLSYRLATYWLPILPGWISFHVLERHNLI
jgi:glycosyltransferase 2 family protein